MNLNGIPLRIRDLYVFFLAYPQYISKSTLVFYLNFFRDMFSINERRFSPKEYCREIYYSPSPSFTFFYIYYYYYEQRKYIMRMKQHFSSSTYFLKILTTTLPLFTDISTMQHFYLFQKKGNSLQKTNNINYLFFYHVGFCELY